MTNLYFDESIRDKGGFIIGALVVSDEDLSKLLMEKWQEIGLDPSVFEYKSSNRKDGDLLARRKRGIVSSILHSSKLGLIVCPRSERDQLGKYCGELIKQIIKGDLLISNCANLYIDQGISFPPQLSSELAALGVTVHLEQDSVSIAGLQVADHGAHSLGSMLLEEMGLLNKKISISHDNERNEIELGFELWAKLRYSLIGVNDTDPENIDPVTGINPYLKIDGYGLYIAPSCNETLSACARSRFGLNYLSCIS